MLVKLVKDEQFILAQREPGQCVESVVMLLYMPSTNQTMGEEN